jgi:hypothetical protein
MAGYCSKHPAEDAAKLAKLPYISGRISRAIEAQVGGKSGLTSRLAQHADANLVDFEPWLKGRKTFRRLASEGVNVGVVKSATIRTSDEGETRRIELHSSQEAIWKLVRMAGYGEGGTDPDAPKPAQVSVTVDLGKMVERQIAEASMQPSAPGLPAPANRFKDAIASPLFAETATARPDGQGKEQGTEKTQAKEKA